MRWNPIPIVGGCYKDDTRPFSVQDTVNWLPVNAEAPGSRSPDLLRSPPGLQRFALVGTGPHRGARNVEGRALVVSGSYLYQLNPAGTFTQLGVIPGAGRVSMSHNQIAGGNEVLIVNGASGYIYNTLTGTLTRITSGSYPGGIVADFIAQLFVQIEPQRRYFFNSALADGLTYSALETYEGEATPDRMVSLKVNHSELIVFSENTTEIFDYTGTTNALFENKKIVIEQGCAATHTPCSLDNSVFFVGADGSAYRINGYTPQRITTHAIEQAWAQSTLSNAFAFTWEDRGHKVWYVTFTDGQTWGYDCATGLWHRRQSYGLNRWRLNTLFEWNGAWYGGDYISGMVYRLDWDYMLEGCDQLVSERTGPVGHDNQNRIIMHALELVFDTGQQVSIEATDGGVALAISGDLPDANNGYTDNYQYTIVGGVQPSTATISAGALPTGLSMNSSGLVTGTRTANGSFSWTVSVTDLSCAGTTVTLNDTSATRDAPVLLYGPDEYKGRPGALAAVSGLFPTSLVGTQPAVPASSLTGLVVVGRGTGSNDVKIWRWSGSIYVLQTITGATPGVAADSIGQSCCSNDGVWVIVPSPANNAVFVYKYNGAGYTMENQFSAGFSAQVSCFSPDETKLAINGGASSNYAARTYSFNSSTGALALLATGSVTPNGHQALDWVGNYLLRSATNGTQRGDILNATTLAHLDYMPPANSVSQAHWSANGSNFYYHHNNTTMATASFNGTVATEINTYTMAASGSGEQVIITKDRAYIMANLVTVAPALYSISGAVLTPVTPAPVYFSGNRSSVWTGLK